MLPGSFIIPPGFQDQFDKIIQSGLLNVESAINSSTFFTQAYTGKNLYNANGEQLEKKTLRNHD